MTSWRTSIRRRASWHSRIDRVRVAPAPAVGPSGGSAAPAPGVRAPAGAVGRAVHRHRASDRRRTGRRIVFGRGERAGSHGQSAGRPRSDGGRGLDREYDLIYTHGARRGSRTAPESASPCPSSGGDSRGRRGGRHPRDGLAAAWAGLHLAVDPDARYIQLWHASGAFKTVGYSRVGKPRGLSPCVRSTRTTRHVDRQLRARRPVLRGGVRHPRGARRRRPASRGWTASSTRRARGGSRRPRSRPSRDRGPDDDPVRADVPRRRPAERPTTTRADRLRGAPCPRRRAGRGRHLQDAPVRPAADSPIPEAFARPPARWDRDAAIDVNDLLFVVDLLITDYSSIVFEFSTLGRPMLFFAYDLDEYIADRDFYVPFEAFVPGPDRADLRRAARRHPARRLRGREGRRLRRAPLRPPRRRLDRPGHRPADPRAMSGVRIVRHPDRRSSGSSFGVARRLPLRHRVVLATAHADEIGGNLASIRDELARPSTAGPRRRPRPSPRVGWRGRVVGGLAARVLAGYHLATARGVHRRRLLLPDLRDPPAPGTTIIQTWHGCGAFKKFGYSVLDKSFGADEALTGRVRDPLQLRRLPRRLDVGRRRTTPRRSASRSSASGRTSASRGPTSCSARSGSPARRAARPRAATPSRDGRRVILYAPTFRGDSVTDAHAPTTSTCGVLRDRLGDDHVLLVRLHPFVRARRRRSGRSSPASPSTCRTTPTSTSCCS